MQETIDLQNMPDEAIAELATRCLDILSLADRVQAVMKAFHSAEDRQELASWLEDEPEEDDED